MMKDYFEAIQVATEAHKHQTRKVDHTPYIAYPLAVSEDKSIRDWRQRKTLYIDSLRCNSTEARLLSRPTSCTTCIL
ncbi:MAG: hypothetical protein WCG80_06705 [Spirochaetales bacterium]